MDILNDNNDNDDVQMADSNNDDSNNHGEEGNTDNNNSGDEGDGIDHERLRQLSNYADQNEDDATWYWNVMDNAQPGHILYPAYGWPAYRPLSSLSEEEREEIENEIDKCYYQLTKRGGYISSPQQEIHLSIRKRSIYMFTEGSIFPYDENRTGKLVNLNPNSEVLEAKQITIKHPIWRDGQAIFVPMKLEENAK